MLNPEVRTDCVRTIQSMVLDALRTAGRILETTKKLNLGIDSCPTKDTVSNATVVPPGLFGKLESLNRILIDLDDQVESIASRFGLGFGEEPCSRPLDRPLDEAEYRERLAREMQRAVNMGAPDPRTFSRR